MPVRSRGARPGADGGDGDADGAGSAADGQAGAAAQGVGERGEVAAAGVAVTVDEEGGGAGGAAVLGGVDVALHAQSLAAAVEVADEGVDVEAQRARVGGQVGVLEGVLVAEEEV